MAKFTFKNNKPTGRYKCFHTGHIDIKLKGKIVGAIWPPDRNEKKITISLMVEKNDINEDGNPNCSWKWITLKYIAKTLDDAKEFVNKYFNEINEKYNLHSLEK